MTTTACPFSDFPGLLTAFASRGEQPALTFYRGKAPAGRLSYAEALARVQALAAVLVREHQISRGDRVALLAPNRLEVPVLVLSLLRLGATVVPLNPASSPEDWSYILSHSRARGVFASADLLDRLVTPAASMFGGFKRTLEELASLHDGAPLPPAPDLSEALGAVLYTSGTTGNPKGVALRQRNLLANGWSMAQHFSLQGAVQLAVLPLYHAHAFGFGLMTALTTGGHLVFVERLEPFTWAAVINAEQVAVSSVVPTLLPMLLAAGITREKVPSLRHLLVSSAPLSKELARSFETRTQIRLVQGWGQSEYTNFACCLSPGAAPAEHEKLMYGDDVPSVGPALPGTEVRVVDGSEKDVAAGTIGELLIRGHSTMQGYLDDREATARALDGDGWLHTGDEGFFRTHEGHNVFFITGRLKEIIIRDAEKYSPLRLERMMLEAMPELAGTLVVVGFPHEEHGEEVGAYLQLETISEDFKSKLTTAVASLPVPERPKVILYGAEPIPRTHTGKIQRRKVQPWFEGYRLHRGPLVVASKD